MRALAPIVLALAWGCAAPDPAPRERVRVASDLDNAPFAFVDPSGEPAGRDVEMMRALAERAGLELAWQRLPFEELLPAAEAGRVDVVCATLGVTPERAERVAFSRPYFRTRIVAVARRGAGEPTRLDELAGRRVAAGRGTTSERAVQRALPLAHLASEAKSQGTTEERLRAREIDAAVMDEPAAAALVARSPEAFVILEPALADENYALALPRGRADLLAELDRALAELEADGWLSRLDAAHGLARLLAPAQGSDPDADGDGLCDFQEVHKYRTDPRSPDSDGDGVADGDPDERREWTYTVRTIIQVLPPVTPDVLCDDFQDARILEAPDENGQNGQNGAYVELEVVHYPLCTAGEAIEGDRAWRSNLAGLEPWLASGPTSNWDEGSRAAILAGLREQGLDGNALDDRALVEAASAWLLEHARFEDGFTTFAAELVDGEVRVHPLLAEGVESSAAERGLSVAEVWERELFAKGMLEHGVRGSCTSSAIYLNGCLRAVGVPARIVLAVPLIDASDERELELLDRLRHPKVRRIAEQGTARARRLLGQPHLQRGLGRRPLAAAQLLEARPGHPRPGPVRDDHARRDLLGLDRRLHGLDLGRARDAAPLLGRRFWRRQPLLDPDPVRSLRRAQRPRSGCDRRRRGLHRPDHRARLLVRRPGEARRRRHALGRPGVGRTRPGPRAREPSGPGQRAVRPLLGRGLQALRSLRRGATGRPAQRHARLVVRRGRGRARVLPAHRARRPADHATGLPYTLVPIDPVAGREWLVAAAGDAGPARARGRVDGGGASSGAGTKDGRVVLTVDAVAWSNGPDSPTGSIPGMGRALLLRMGPSKDFPAHKAFTDACDRVFLLEAEGAPTVSVSTSVGGITNGEGSYAVADPESGGWSDLAPGMRYTIRPRNKSSTHRWRLAQPLTIVP